MRDIIKSATFWQLLVYTCIVLLAATCAGAIDQYMNS